MIATIAFLVAFVVLGLGVVFLAMSGGPKGVRGRARRPSRAGRRTLGVILGLVIVGIGLAVPALVLIANNESQAEQGPGGVELNAAEQDGRQLFARNCSTCHTLRGANGVGKVGPNLDQLRPPKNLTLDAIAKGRARGQGQMPAGLLDGEDAEHVAVFVAKVAGR